MFTLFLWYIFRTFDYFEHSSCVRQYKIVLILISGNVFLFNPIVVFKLPGQLRAHLKRIHWVITYQADRHCSDRKCLSCHKLFHDLDTFRKHCVEDHSMVSCNLCPRVFPSYRNLQKHQSVTHGNSKQINTLPKVKIDKASVTSNVEEGGVYKCPYCNFCTLQ